MATQTEERILQLTSNRAINNQLLAEQKIKAQNNGNQKILDSQPTESDKKPFGVRAWETTFDVFGNIAYGAAKGLEGIVDFAANITGVFGDEDYKEKVKNFVQNNWTEENLSIIKDNTITDDSYLKDASETAQKIGYGVSQGIGQMLPSIALAAATAGIGGAVGASSQAVSTASQVASLGSLGLSAAGSSTESAYAENDANYGMATLYGALSGAVEIATEKLFGGIEKLGITGVADDVVDSAISKITKSVNGDKFIKALADLGEEGIEEMISEFVDPYLQRATINPDAENATPQEILEAGLIGALTAAAMNGTSSIARNATTKGRATEALNSAEIAVNKYNELALKEDVTEAELQNWRNQAETYFKKAESLMTNISEEKRLKYLKDNLGSKSVNRRENAKFLNKYFNEDGILKNGLYKSAEEVTSQFTNITQNKEIRNKISSSNYSRNIDEVIKAYNDANKDAEDYKPLTVENIKNAEINDANQQLLKEINDSEVFKGVNVILVEKGSLGGDPAATSRASDTIFIDSSIDNYAQLDEYTAHEIVAHFLTNIDKTYGNAAGRRIQKSIQELINKDGEMLSTITKILEKRQNLYGEKLIDNVDENGVATFTELGREEMVGEFIQQVYSHEGMTLIHKLANKNQTLLKKLVNYYKDKMNGISHKDSSFYKMFAKDMQYLENVITLAIANRDSSVTDFEEAVIQGFWIPDDKVEEMSDIRDSHVTWTKKGEALLRRACKLYNIDPKPIVAQIEAMYENLKNIAEETRLDSLDKNLNADVEYSVLKDKSGNFRQVASVLVKNGDYVINFDLSTRCKKKHYFQKVIEALAKAGFFDGNIYSPDDIESIRTILQAEGYEIPCAMCFVENRRIYQGEWAKQLVEYWNNAIAEVYGIDYLNDTKNKANFSENNIQDDFFKWQEEYAKLTEDLKKDQVNEKGMMKLTGRNNKEKILNYVKSLKNKGINAKVLNTADFLTMKGMKNLRTVYPEFAQISLSSYGAGTPKITLDYTPYNSEFALLTNNFVKDMYGSGISGFGEYYKKHLNEWNKEHKSKPEGDDLLKIENAAMKEFLLDIGGARFQSFSDAQIEEVFDILQLIADGAANGYSLELYSKEYWEHRLLGKTGAKQNMSLISLVFDDQIYAEDLAGLREIKSLDESTTKITVTLAKNEKGQLLYEGKGKEKHPIIVTEENRHLYNNFGYYETIFADYENNIKFKDATFAEYAEAYTDSNGIVKKAGTPIQSIGFKDAVALELLDGYSKNVGTIAIGFSYPHIVAMLNNPLIRMVIPYHKSGLSKLFGKPLKCSSAKDYTDYQTTKIDRWLDDIKVFDENGNQVEATSSLLNKIKKAIDVNSFKWNKELQKIKDAKKCADAYLEDCRKEHKLVDHEVTLKDANGNSQVYKVTATCTLTPKFSMFAWHPKYYKLLEDFNCYDTITDYIDTEDHRYLDNVGENAPQEELKFILPDGKYTQNQIDEYAKRLMSTGIFTAEEVEEYCKKAQMTASKIIEAEVKNRANYLKQGDAKFDKVMESIRQKLSSHKNPELKYDKKAKRNVPNWKKITQTREEIKLPSEAINKLEVRRARYKVQVSKTESQTLGDGAEHKITTIDNKEFDTINQVAVYTLKRYFGKKGYEGVSAKTLNKQIAELINNHNDLTEAEYQSKINDMIDSYIKLTAIESVATSILEEASITKEAVNLEFIYDNAKKYLEDNGYTEGKNQKTILTKIRQELSKAVYGQNTDLSEVSATLKKLRQDAINQAEIYRQKNQLFVKARQLGEMLASKDNPKVVNEIASNEAFKKALKGVKNISLWKGEISKPNIQKFLNFMNEWFNPANEGMAELFVAEREGASLSSTDADARDRIINGEYGLLKLAMYNLNAYFNRSTYNPYERLTIEFIDNAKTLLAQSYKLFKDFNARMFGDKKIKIKELANDIYQEQVKTNIINGEKKISLIKTAFGQMVDPRTYFLMLTGNNPNSEFMQMFNQLQKDEVACVNKFHELTTPITSMLNDKNYSKHFSKDTIELKTKNGTILLTVNQAMDLFLMAGQEDAQEGLKVNGFSYKDIKGNKRKVEGVNVYDILGGTETLEDGSTVEHQGLAFTEEDKKFMEAIKLMYSQLTEIKAKADLDIYFMTNIVANYYPLRREGDAFSKIIGMNPNRFVQTIYNIASNKDRNKQSTAQLAVGDVYSKAIGQADIMTKYGIIGKDIDTFGRVLGIAFRPNNEGSKTSIIAKMKEYDKNSETYINNFLTDLIGNRSSDSFAALKKIRGAWATAQLGFNPKIVMSQLASLPTLYNFYDTSIMGKALITRVDENEMFEHSPYAKARYVENSIFKSESNVEKISSNISKFASKFTMAIQWMDKNVIKTAWAAAKLQVEKDTRLQVGSEEYWQKVDAVFTNSVRLSQPQYSASERSALQRSTNEFAKAVTMFSSVSVKYLSLIVQHIDRVIYDKKQLKLIQAGKIEGNAEAVAKTLEKSKKTLATAATSVVVANIMFVLIKKLFDALYNKDDEDEEGNQTFEAWFEDFAKNFGGSMIGMIPLLKEVYNYFVNGYDVENYTYSMVNDVLASTKELTDIIISFSSGEEVPQAKILRNSRNIVYSLSAIFGLPVRNATNTITGLISRVSEEFKYDYNNLFNTNPKYASDIKKALDNNDQELANHIFGLYVTHKGIEQTTETNMLIADLYSKGYSSVTPKSVGNSINYNGETYALNRQEIAHFKAIYQGAEKSIMNMTRSDLFKQASDETKARAIKMVYDYYYTLAVRDYIKDNNYSKIEMFGEIIPIEKLAIIIKECQSISGDNKKLEVMKIINRQRLSNAQKYMVLGYLGYSNTNGYNQVLAEVKKLKLNEEKTKEMLKYCGY